MAIFTTGLSHPLYSWCLPQLVLYIPTTKNSVLSHNMPKTNENLQLSPYSQIFIHAMLQKIRSHLWEVIRKVIHHCMSCRVHLNTSMFFMCTRKTVAMTGKSEKRGLCLETQDKPGGGDRTGESTPDTMVKKSLEPQKKIMEDPVDVVVTKPDKFAPDVHKVMFSNCFESGMSEEAEDDNGGDNDEDDVDDDSREDENKEDQAPEEEEEQEWSEEEDSDWSDDEDSEVSTESEELWESFLNTSDPYNPLYFSSSTGVKAKTLDAREGHLASSPNPSEVELPPSTDGGEQRPEWYSKEGTKKVRFSEEVTMRHLVAWTFASRAARDGSCWLQLARDRDRFRRRVEKAGKIISPCLTAKHRARVWERHQRGFCSSDRISA